MIKATERIPWHALKDGKFLERLTGTPSGLTSSQALERLHKIGPNVLVDAEGINPLRLLASQFHNPLIYLLIGAAALSVATGSYVDAGVIAGVVILNAVLGFSQEWRAEGALEALQKMSAPQARVLRDGRRPGLGQPGCEHARCRSASGTSNRTRSVCPPFPGGKADRHASAEG